ncbi:MAG: TonB-dependent receptor [Hyphomonadaceae bacterium]|nr:TonB-dependent receptor [Hyphomonadaceae bacterium]
MRTNRFGALALGVTALSLVTAAPALAQDEEEEIVVTGTRTSGTLATESLSPVDVLPAGELSAQGSTDLTDQLTNIAPSINTQRFPISDGTAVVRPVSLRNLPPDSTLVLINGARRHRSALVNLQAEPFGTVNQGAQAVDFQLIPSIAIQRLEVLRDGASAQYGSDAIAGVINVILREESVGFDVNTQYGKFYSGDGENYQVAANFGLPLGPDGFLNISGEYVSSGITSRGSARPDAAAVAAAIGAENVPFNGLGQRWGDPDVEGWRFFANGQTDLGGVEAYGHASYADQETFSGFFYRTPFGVPGVNPRSTLCNCTAGVPNNTPQQIVTDIINAGLNPADYLTADAGSPSGYVSLNPIWTQFPGGYNPTFGADVQDFALVLGARGTTSYGMTWDLSGRLGQNEIAYFLENSINPSLGRLSPTSFNPGTLEQRETGVNLDFVYPWEVGLFEPVNVAFGLEWRDEAYTISAGDPASYASGPTASIFGVGSDGFQGDSPAAAGEFSSDSAAAYVDAEATLTDRLTVGVAGRYEDYSAFGSTFDWKLSGRYEPVDGFAVRGTVSTGFRAPTPGQINTLDVTTTADASGNLVPQGTFPVNSPVAQILGAELLDPEESINYTVGFIYNPSPDLSVTLDFYRIEVDSRVALLTQTITPGSPEDIALTNAGFPGIGTAAFFANAFDTQVEGVEIAVTKDFDLGSAGQLSIDARHSWNQQEIQRVLFPTVNGELLYDFENQLPAHRTVITGTYYYDDTWEGLVRFNRYGEWEDLTFGELGTFEGKWLVDAEVSANIGDHYRISVGAENLFNTYPDDETNSVLSFLGATRPISSPFGFNGGFWYARLGVDF